MTHKILVYGTLRPGDTPTVTVPGRIYDLGWFPGIVLGDGPGVVCEVIEVDDARLKQLDQYEGYDPHWPEDSLYVRVQHDDAFIYVYNNDIDDRPLVESGDWLQYKSQKTGANSHLGQQ